MNKIIINALNNYSVDFTTCRPENFRVRKKLCEEHAT